MKKISRDFIIGQYQSGIESYAAFTTEVGLWASEKYVFKKYLKQTDSILDLGCGTGRTTFPLFELGFEKIRGVDLTPEMVKKANELNAHFGTNIIFEVGDATKLSFSDASFEKVIFSFNGLMSIPGASNQKKAVSEINRVLKTGGIFIFTTHDRDMGEDFFQYWETEKEKWASGDQNPELYEFGDIIADSKNESEKIFIHIPNRQEILNLINESGFELIETFYRSNKFRESEKVKEKSGECRFWVTGKKNS